MHVKHHYNITNNTENPRQPKLAIIVRVAWRTIPCRQAIHEETQKTGSRACAPGRSRVTAKQFLENSGNPN